FSSLFNFQGAYLAPQGFSPETALTLYQTHPPLSTLFLKKIQKFFSFFNFAGCFAKSIKNRPFFY
ncbi:MAG: hypothetical protein J6A67_03390, partial [Clostridia bacterium]|nr:hypothetical protein [Clostridia bacterium]